VHALSSSARGTQGARDLAHRPVFICQRQPAECIIRLLVPEQM
jgi:hypothetical protein